MIFRNPSGTGCLGRVAEKHDLVTFLIINKILNEKGISVASSDSVLSCVSFLKFYLYDPIIERQIEGLNACYTYMTFDFIILYLLYWLYLLPLMRTSGLRSKHLI